MVQVFYPKWMSEVKQIQEHYMTLDTQLRNDLIVHLLIESP